MKYASMVGARQGSGVLRHRGGAESRALWKAVLFTGSVFMVIVSVYWIIDDDAFHDGWNMEITAVLFAWCLVYLIATYRYFGSMYLFTTTYLLSLGVFHLSYIVGSALGVFTVPDFGLGGMSFWHQKAGWYTLLSMGCIGVGMSVSWNAKRFMAGRHGQPELDSGRRLSRVYWTGVGLFCASMVALGFAYIKVGNILQFSRSEIFGGVGDTRGFGFFIVVVPSAVVLLVMGAYSISTRVFSYVTSLSVFLGLMFLGYRSSALFSALIGAVIWVKLGRKLPVYVVVAAVVFVLVAIPTVRYLRAMGPYQDITSADLRTAYHDAQVVDVFQEVGGTSSILANVLRWVPDDVSYSMGRTYLNAIKNAIPNVGLDIRKSAREEVKSSGRDRENLLQQINPSDWYTYRTNKWAYRTGGGTGFSTIAEAYLNFGGFGVAAFFLGLGLLLGRLDQADLRRNTGLLIFAGAMLWPLLKTVRNSFGVFVKPLVFILVVITLLRLVTYLRPREHRSTGQRKIQVQTPLEKR